MRSWRGSSSGLLDPSFSGDVVVPGPETVVTNNGEPLARLVLSDTPYQGPIAGIVSNNWGDFTSAGNNIADEDNPMPIALVGRVPVNVTDENGPVHVGDFLTTSSTPGYAMKATEAGRVLGMALADFDSMEGQVMVQVINTWYEPEERFQSLVQKVEGLEAVIQALNSRLEQLEKE